MNACGFDPLRSALQARKFREQVSAFKADQAAREAVAAELVEMQREDAAANLAARHRDFGSFYKGYKQQGANGGAPAKAKSTLPPLVKPARAKPKVKAKPAAQVATGGDSKGQAAYKGAVCDVVKAELVAALNRREISKQQFKDIARRATEKVVGTTTVRAPHLCIAASCIVPNARCRYKQQHHASQTHLRRSGRTHSLEHSLENGPLPAPL